MTTHFQGKTFKRNHQDNSNPYQAQLKQLEKDYIEKFTVAQNIFNRVKHYTSELEILISGVIKVYCGTGFSEKNRIDFLLKNIHNELHDFEERITISEVIEQYDLYPEDLKQKVSPRHLFNDSLLSSTRSDTNTMLAIKNEVKDLISDYRDAVDKLKEENKTIQALVNDRKHNKEFDDKENISFNITRSPNYLKREKSLDESEIEEKVEEGKKVSKYAELSRFINDLNKKKEENMRKLATIETRLATIRKNTADEDQGVLKASDLNREEDRPAVMRSAKKQSMEPGSVSKGKRTHEDQKDYLNYMKEVTELSKRKRLGRQQKEPLSVNRSKKSANESSVLEDEIDQLNKEIDTIKGLLDSAIIQKKYQQK